MSHIHIRQFTLLNQSCHTKKSVTSRIQMSHVTHMNESCHKHEWVMSPVKAFDLEPPVISIMTVFYQNFSKVNPTVNLSSKSSGELTFENFDLPIPLRSGQAEILEKQLAAKWTIWNEYTTDFWEFYLSIPARSGRKHRVARLGKTISRDGQR